MDVQLADGKSFEIFRQAEVPFPIIFTTAYDQYAIEAFKVNSVDYLLKPIGVPYLKAALEKFQKIHQEGRRSPQITQEQLAQLLGGGQYKKRFVATLGDRIVQLPVADIAYFYADDDTVFLVTDQGKRYVINFKLEQLAQVLDPAQFFRINRKYVACIRSIKEINKYFNGRLLLSLSPPTPDEVLVSRAKVQEFLSWIDG
jgi:DNA-binding LytR/AlgR family response regulator